MKKKYLPHALAALLAVGGVGYGWHYAHVRHPVVQCSEKSCTFLYDLCVPMPPPMACEKRTFSLSESMGTDTNFTPWPKRPREYTTFSDLRFEAEQRANIIENVNPPKPEDMP